MTQTAEVRDWLGELRIAADADDDGASFQEIVEAGLLYLEGQVYEVAAENWDDGEVKARGLWAGAVASFFGPSPQPEIEEEEPYVRMKEEPEPFEFHESDKAGAGEQAPPTHEERDRMIEELADLRNTDAFRV
jgi:hypothetical protein